MNSRGLAVSFFLPFCLCASVVNIPAAEPKPIKILFLGDNGHHRPAERFRQLQPVLAARGIDLTYTDKADALSPQILNRYDGLLIYANTDKITPEQEKALLDFVEHGKGFIPLHCASYCFLNSPKYIALVGAQFKSHGTGAFRAQIAEPNHPIMKGFNGFESWDETYVHTKHNEKDRTVLEYRVDGDKKEPWTWVRTQGKGRVFYTAWGHDERTWSNPGFQSLVERGIRWAVGGDPGVVPTVFDTPEMTKPRTDVKPFEYVDANVPFYPPSPRWGVTAAPLKKMQKPLDPAESVKHYVTPVGFEMKLFVAEDQLGGKPICMNWDERGRLWVAVTVDYPNDKQPDGQGHDRILICEDTKGEGRADKITTFADKLSIPTSLTFANGGVIVTQAPHTLFLKDTDGDGVADERRVLFTGWGTSDTHAGPSNLQYGFDNWIYGIVGYAGFNGTVGGERHRFGQGFFRFKPDGSKLEFLRSSSNNSWGVGFSEDGELFGSTANGNPSMHMPIPNRFYESVRGWSSTVLGMISDDARYHPITDKVRQVDWHGQFTAAAGHAIYTARTYPREYWNRTAFVSDPTGHLTATFVIRPDGSSYRTKNSWNLVASDDEWAAPIMAEVGPDGNVWIIDWYAYIVQHNPTPPGFRTGKGAAYETPLRDKTHGRIYRLVYTGAKSPGADATRLAKKSLKDASPKQLVATLKDANLFWRRQAQRLLVERGDNNVVSDLLTLATDASVDEIGLNVGAIHALWTLNGMEAKGIVAGALEQAGIRALENKSAAVRRNALLALPPTPNSAVAILDLLAKESDLRVRLAGFEALAVMPHNRGARLVEELRRPINLEDRSIRDALTCAAAKVDWLVLASLGSEKNALPPQALSVITTVAESFARAGPEEHMNEILAALAEAQPSAAEAVVAGLVKGWPKSGTVVLKDGVDQALARLLERAPSSSKGQVLRLALLCGSKSFEKRSLEVAAALLATIGNDKASDTARAEAAAQLIDFRKTDADAAKQLLAVLTPRTSPELAQGLIDAVARTEAAPVGALLLESLSSFTPGVKAMALRAILARSDWTNLLLDAADRGKFDLAELSLDQKQALAAYPARSIAAKAKRLLAKAGGLPNADRQKVIDDLTPLTKQTGDAAVGKMVFKNFCAKCHMHGGEGAHVGPDLTGMAVHPKAHLLVEIMDPSRSVEGNYRQYTVTTKSGKVLTGLLASESKTAIELIDAEAKKQTLLREDIDELLASNKSLMPDGFEKQLKPEDIVNLLEFLTQRGKYLPLPLGKVATAVSTRGMFYSEDSPAERLIFADWSPKTFQGVPFQLVDPQEARLPNVILLYSPQGSLPPKMPKSVSLPCNVSAAAVHLLSGVSGWGFPYAPKGSVSMIVRLHYDDGQTEDHALKNGEEFADYIRRVDVPGSQFAFSLRGQQIRYLTVRPKRNAKIETIEFVKGEDQTAPVVMAVTIEAP
jgi:putative membrane-bound dehydrogenase-like protein